MDSCRGIMFSHFKSKMEKWSSCWEVQRGVIVGTPPKTKKVDRTPNTWHSWKENPRLKDDF